MSTAGNRPNGQGFAPRAIAPDAADALARAADVWERRLAEGWTPPEGSTFPWSMVRRSLAALLPGMREWGVRSQRSSASYEPPKQIALILAGNTPLLAWSPLAACLLAGHTIHVKMSRGETLWPRLFRDALAEVAPEIAARITLDVWPGDDPRTAALIAASDCVIAFGSDETLAILRALTPLEKPFYGYGYGASVGLIPRGIRLFHAKAFALDVLLYDQAGCLSPQALFVEETEDPQWPTAVVNSLSTALRQQAEVLGVPPVSDPAIARRIRTARDMALFSGATVRGDDTLRWTVIAYPEPIPLMLPTGHSIISIMPIRDAIHDFGAMLGALCGHLSSVGVSGEIPDELRAAIRAEGASRICLPGEMQTPPLDWPNGNIDLLAELLRF